MSRLADKQICLVVTGGIAAYKAPDIVRQLKAAGAQVQVVMTAAAITNPYGATDVLLNVGGSLSLMGGTGRGSGAFIV